MNAVSSLRTPPTVSRPVAEAPVGASTSTSAEAAPDLVVDWMVPSNSFPMPGSPVWYSVTVSNRGDAPAGAFDVQLRGIGGFATERVSGLEPGASTRLSMGPAWATMGGSALSSEVLVDARNEVAEKNEGNNFEWSTVMVQQPPVIPLPPIPPHASAAPKVLLAE